MKSYNIEKIALLGVFFPFFMFVPITSEVQPISLLFWIIVVIFYNRVPIELSKYMMVCAFIISINLILQSVTGDFIASRFLTSSVLIALPIITYCFIKTTDTVDNLPLMIKVMVVWFLFSAIQSVAPSVFSSTGIDSIIQILIPRFSSSFVNEGRGVTGLAPEPSYAAYVYLSLIVWLWYLKSTEQIDNQNTFIIYGFLLLCLIMNKSIFGIMVLGFSVFLFIPKKIIFIITTILFFLIIGGSGSRFVDFINSAMLIRSFNEFMILLQSFSSTREIGVITGYYGIIDNPFGVGIGGNSEKFFEIMSSFSFLMVERYDNIIGVGVGRPYSYFSFLVFEIGVLITPLIIIFISNINTRKIIFMCITHKGYFVVLVFSIFLVLLRSPVSMPSPMICIALAVRLSLVKSNES
ncbi:hypothetical protein BTO01_04780 [Vibrio jasicida]|uniref:hypothetical protein n=1 Tax=Vibrio jasicida TaxID=766224 RepID=UPI000CF54638|nr:hypothetical protein [Vibrio jasicida]PQJ70628.1 hypothetical protein BTO01_04780 [Vibrio jasicida]